MSSSSLQQLSRDRIHRGCPVVVAHSRVSLAEAVKEALDDKELPHLGRYGTGLQRTLIIAALQNDVISCT